MLSKFLIIWLHLRNYMPASIRKIIFAVITVMLITTHVYSQCSAPVINFDTCKFLTMGHRAYSAVYPENTLMALEELFKRGVKYAEVDISLTKDGHAVLFHDESSVHRTMNTTGNLGNYTLAELKQWEVGSWNGSHFSNIKIPTLVEALLVAEKYDGHLYLDLKSYTVTALKNAMVASGVAPDRFLPAIATIADANNFRQQLPNCPWIWYQAGRFPDAIDDINFYQQCINLGCFAFEVSSGRMVDSGWSTFTQRVHEAGSKVVVFTLNDPTQIQEALNNGADGFESDRPWEAKKQICNNLPPGTAFDSTVVGNWLFEGNLFGTAVGSQLRHLKYENPPVGQAPVFGSCSLFNLPTIDGVDKVVMKVPAMLPENGLLVYNNSRVEDYGILDRTFTVIMDVLMPTSSAGKWISLFQTSVTNSNDAELFINPSGRLGISGDYHGTITPNTWTRIAFTVDCEAGLLKKFINGKYVGASEISTDSRWAIWNNSRSGNDQGFLIFADDDDETADMFVSSLQTRSYIMDSAHIVALGGASARGVKLGNADSWFAQLDIAYHDSTILDYENRTYYFVIPHQSNADSAVFTHQLSQGAVSNISLLEKIAIAPMEYTWQVTSEDSTRKKTWKACIRKATLTSGLSDITSQKIQFEAYPNPAQQEVTLTKTTHNQANYTLLSVLGKTLQTGTFTQSTTIPLTGLTTGVYWIVVTENGLSATKKILVIN